MIDMKPKKKKETAKWMSPFYLFLFVFLLVLGIILTLGGILALLTNSYSIGTNLRYQQPAIVDGFIFLLIGVGFVYGSYHTFRQYRW
jgi:uncharacterized membrane-anchored protein